MKIKTTMRYHLTPITMAIINISTNNKCWQGCGKRGTFLHCWGEWRFVQPLWKAVWRYFKKLKIDLPFDPVIPLMGIYPKEPKTMIQKNISTSVFIAALFTIVKIWKQPKCPSAQVDKWIKQLWHLYTMEFYSPLKRRKFYHLQQYGQTWSEISEISQSEKDKYHVISLICGIWWTNWTNNQNRDRLIDGEQDDS